MRKSRIRFSFSSAVWVSSSKMHMNGERMIVYQGACSFKFWTGKDMPIHEVKVALGMEESE